MPLGSIALKPNGAGLFHNCSGTVGLPTQLINSAPKGMTMFKHFETPRGGERDRPDESLIGFELAVLLLKLSKECKEVLNCDRLGDDLRLKEK